MRQGLKIPGIFHPQMTPKTRKKNSGKNDFEKVAGSQPLWMALVGLKSNFFNSLLPIDSSHGDISSLF